MKQVSRERKSVLVIRLSSLGDVVISTVVPQILKDYFDVYFLTKKVFSDIIQDIPYIRILTLNNYSVRELARLIYRLRTISPDYIIDLQDKPITYMIRFLLDPLKRKTFVWDSQRIERRLSILSKDFSRIRPVFRRFSDVAFAVLERDGVSECPYDNPSYESLENRDNIKFLPKIFPPDEPQDKNLMSLSNYVVVAPESVWRTKMWNLSECKKLVRSLENKGVNVVLVGKNTYFNDVFDVGTRLFGKVSLRDLKYIVSKSLCVVSVDSAVSHIASALGVPVVSVFTSSDPRMGFYPINSKVTIKKNVRCRPCSLHGKNYCPSGHWLCTYVPYQEVEEAVMEIIEKRLDGKLI